MVSSDTSIRDSPRGRTLTTVSGVSTSIFIRSTSVVPPARNIASRRAATALAASVARATRSRVKGFIQHLPHGGNDVHVGAAATQVAAHPFADLLVCERRAIDRLSNVSRDVTRHARVRLLNGADGREDLSRCAVAALKAIAVQERGLHRVK